MNSRHLDMRVKQCFALATLSPCPRRKYGAVAIDPVENVILSEGFNGGPRGGARLCGTETTCRRDGVPMASPPNGQIRMVDPIPSGTRYEIGCAHAEMNVVCNAARVGHSLKGAWLICTGIPCLGCAKLIHHSGVAKVITIKGGYAGENGASYLREHGVVVEEVDPPTDNIDIGPVVDGGGR